MSDESCREQIMSEDYWDFLIPNYRQQALLPFEQSICIQKMDFEYQSAYVLGSELAPLTIEKYWYNSIPQCYALLDMEALNHAGILTVQNYPSLELMGENIMLGFVDTGIEYENPIFRNLDGTTRIAGIWDQTVQTGTPPPGFDYGSAYTEMEINEALRSENAKVLVPTEDENGHGTYVASVAAGGGDPENQFLGAAPESLLGVVKLKPAKKYLKDFYAIREDAVCFQENDIMLGLTYLNNLATERNVPIVLCIALGTNFGGHNGTSLLSGALDLYSLILNHSVVIGAGNEAAQRHHYFHQFSSITESVNVEIRVGEGVKGFVAEMWTAIPNVMTVSVISPSGGRTGDISLRQGASYFFDFAFERTTLSVEYRLLLENNDSQLLFMRFTDPTPGIWRIEVRPLQISGGEFHIWLPITEFLSGEVYFLEANPDTTLTEPGSSRGPMTVSYYNQEDKGVDINSGRGYTRDKLIKPDYTAPGVGVKGALPGGRFVGRSGSSAGTAISAGAVALLMEWLLSQTAVDGVNSSQIRNLIVLGAVQRPFLEYPNREWGYGILDLYQILDRLRNL